MADNDTLLTPGAKYICTSPSFDMEWMTDALIEIVEVFRETVKFRVNGLTYDCGVSYFVDNVLRTSYGEPCYKKVDALSASN